MLNVGGTRFESSRSTLERASSYFRSLLTRWDDASDEPLFIDCDANAFEILLSYMRIGVLTLPQHDEALCIRVLMHAEYLGLESLLEEVKLKAYMNMHPGSEDHPASVASFDEEVGGSLADAVASKVLPARYFAPAEPPPPPPPARARSLSPRYEGDCAAQRAALEAAAASRGAANVTAWLSRALGGVRKTPLSRARGHLATRGRR